MNTRQILKEAVEKNRDLILSAERTIWNHPETGFREWETHRYLKEQYEKLGYTVREAGNIPGFYVDITTGRPGPRVAVFGEMDSLIIPGHPECSKPDGYVHACGHNAQSAALLGMAAALKAPGALDELSGNIRLFAVPAEELIEIEYRSELIQKGIIQAYGGKQEFLLRGYLDDCDMAFMIHTGKSFNINVGCNGCLIKKYTFIGKASHAASPHNANNALYAATNAMGIANALRETFSQKENIRFHPIITAGGDSVNVIPDRVVVEAYVRGLTIEAMEKVNKQINRAFASAAAGMSCRLLIEDHLGYAPRTEDRNLVQTFVRAAEEYLPAEQIKYDLPASTGCTDMGDISLVMPVIHPHIGGSSGAGHSIDYRISEPETACVLSAKIQLSVLCRLLENDAEIARKVIAEKKVPYASVEEYRQLLKRLDFASDAVIYNPDGTITLKYSK